MEGGVDGGDGVGWRSLIQGPDRPSMTASPNKGGRVLDDTHKIPTWLL